MQDTHENNMNAGPGRPSGGGGRNRRRRGRRPPNRGGHDAGRDRQQHGGIYTAPMDHSYRAAFGGNGPRPGRQRPGFAPSYAQAEPEPLPQREDANSGVLPEPATALAPPRCSRRRKRYLVFLAATRHSIAEECFFLRACAPRWGLLVPSIPVATANSALRSNVRVDGRRIGLLARQR